MRTITPTSYARDRQEVARLGSMRALIEKLPVGAVLVVASLGTAIDAYDWMEICGRERSDFHLFFATSGPNELRAYKPDCVIGIAEGAFDRIRPEMYLEMRVILASRFKTVLWA